MTENVLTLGSLFDGSGGFPLGGMLAGIKPIWASEIEPFPIRVTTKRLPEIKHYGDINKLSGAELEPVDIITFGSPCFPTGTLVLTDKGYKDIKDIKVGDTVLTHKGNWKSVLETGCKFGETYVLEADNGQIECTANHPFYSTVDGKDKMWTPAIDMKNKFWAVTNYHSDKYHADSGQFKDELHTWYKVQTIKETNQVKVVYNLEVEDDHSYIVNGVAVHNCQDLSHAGKRVGIQGSRSSLFFEAVRVIKEMREATNGKYPRFIVWENVSGARSSNKGKDFQEVLKQICSIKEGEVSIPEPDKGKWLAAGEIVGNSFSVAWRQLDAVNWGVPQRRKRIYLVADFASRGGAGKILFESEGLSRYSPKSFKTWQTITRCSETGSGDASELCLNDQGGSCIDVSHNITGTLRAEMHGHQPVVLQENKDETVVYGISGYQSNAMKSANPNSGIYEAESARTLDLNGGNPNCNQGGMMICSPYPAPSKSYLFENHGQDSRYKGPLKTAPTVWAGYGTGGTNRPFVVTENQGSTYALHHGGFPYWNKDVSPTLTDRDCKDPTVINQPKTLLFGQHKQGAVYTGPLDVCSTIMAAFGEGGNNTPIVVHEDE